MAPPRPNVLFLMTDEHRPDAAGFAGHPLVRTPRLDALAEDAVVFRHAYTPSPICIPARQSLASGLLPRHAGVEVFGQDLPPGSMTFARRFSQYGYATVACGKLHHMGTDQMQGWRRRIGAEMQVHTAYVEGRDDASFADRPEPMSSKWTMVEEIQRAGLGPNPIAIDDQYAVDGAINFLGRFYADPHYDRPTPDTPLMLMVSLNEPHYPYATERQDLFEHYLTRADIFTDEVFDHPFLGGRFVARPGREITERQARRAVAAYYAMIETADQRFGRVLDELTRLGQDLDDWIIVYTSDHGEMLGEHGVWEKQKFFESSVGVPLFVRWPARFDRGVVEANVNLCDLFATLCDLAEIPVPDGLDSRSLTGLMTGDSAGWDDESVSQFGGQNLMIKRGPLKYQYYAEDGSEVLFDHAADPGERVNAVGNPAYAQVLPGFRIRRDELGFSPSISG